MPKLHNPYEDNAFKILGMPTTATTQELTAKARRLERLARAEQREEEVRIIEAHRRVKDPNQRIDEELFCHPPAEAGALQPWIDRFAGYSVDLEPAPDWHRWQTYLHHVGLDGPIDAADPEPIRVTISERGDRYEEAVEPLEAITFAR
jgi:hypothetical protein